VTAEKSLTHESKTAFFMEGGGLLFISSPFIHVNTGLTKGEMSLTEFYRTEIERFIGQK